MDPPRTQTLRGRVGDIILVPARVSSVGTDNRSIRLIIDTRGLPSVRVTNSENGAQVGFVDPTLVYHAYNRLPSSMLEHLSKHESFDVIRDDFVSLGHHEEQANRYARHAISMVEDSMSPVDVEVLHAPSPSEWRRRVEEGTRDWERMCKQAEQKVKDQKRRMAMLGLEACVPTFPEEEQAVRDEALPGVMLARGFRK